MNHLLCRVKISKPRNRRIIVIGLESLFINEKCKILFDLNDYRAVN